MTNPLTTMPFSPSRMESLDCPFRFKKLYLPPKQAEPVGEMAIIGRVFHDWIADYARRCLELETNKLRDLSWIKFLDDALVKNEKDIIGFSDTKTIREKTTDLIQPLMDNPDWHLPFDGDQGGFVSIEQQWGFKIKDGLLVPCGWFDPEIDARMIADLIWQEGSVLHVLDHKTGWGEPWEYQLPWYAAGTLARYQDQSWDTLKIHYHWAGKGGQYQEVGFYLRHDLESVTDDVINQIYKARKTTEFPAHECRACSWCGFKSECPILADNALILADDNELPVLTQTDGKFQIIDQRSAERALSAIVMVGGRIKELEKELGEFVKQYGPILNGGKKMEIRESEKWKCTDLEGLFTALNDDLDISLQAIAEDSGMSKTQLLRVLRKAGAGKHAKDLMSTFGTTETVTNQPKIYVDKGE